MDDRCKTCAHYGDNRGEYDWCHMCEMEVDHYKPMDGLISREAAIEALGERPDNWTDTPEEIQAVRDWNNAVNNIKSIPSVLAVPIDKLCAWLARFRVSIPCTFCPSIDTDYCAASGNCPCGAEDWREAITKWMEGLDV